MQNYFHFKRMILRPRVVIVFRMFAGGPRDWRRNALQQNRIAKNNEYEP